MIILNDLLNFPSFYRDRRQSLEGLIPTITNFKELDTSYLFEGKVGKYNVAIEFIKKEPITLKSPVRVECSCASFKYEFAAVLFRNRGLYNRENFFVSLPKEKNKFSIISGCKHIISFANYVLKNNSKFIKGDN